MTTPASNVRLVVALQGVAAALFCIAQFSVVFQPGGARSGSDRWTGCSGPATSRSPSCSRAWASP